MLSKVTVELQELVGTGVWTQGFMLAGALQLEPRLQVHFALVILEMRSCELFAQAWPVLER
jgi:hypothetical protein